MNEYGIAIKTTFKKFKEAIKSNEKSQIMFCKISYIDYKKHTYSRKNLLNVSLLKRKSFSHENELRAIMYRAGNNKRHEVTEFGAEVSVNINVLIGKIYLSPTAPDWVVDLLKEICCKYDISADVVKSDLLNKID